MHVAVDLNLNWFLQFIVTIFILGLGFGFRRIVKNTASKFFVFEDPNNHSSSSSSSDSFGMAADATDPCAVCGNKTNKRCSRCKVISYCSQACQRSHWISEHKATCNNLKSISKANLNQSKMVDSVHHSRKILFPYGEFVELFNWESPGFSPCGLLNCGNSCFANVVLQCLAYTKPLAAYLLVKGHKRECRRNDWCFLCELQIHLERASQSLNAFSPINILSRLPQIGGNLGHNSQEDAHEFMRIAIDTMQSVCLDQFGGEKAVHPRSQETTLIQHIFGGQLQSQVICTKCNNMSNQLENMMDLTVEIQGDAASLEECLDQFTAKEWLHGENMYKCDRCNEYVTAWKRLSVLLPPNILTIALKRFQSGRFGKLNKSVTFPETLDLNPYMSKQGGDGDIYKLYAVIVHVDMLNASFFGHYICCVKDFQGQWYRIDDSKVARVDLDEVLSQRAYMVLYSRARARPRCMYPSEANGQEIKKDIEHNEESSPSIAESVVECPSSVTGQEIKKDIDHNEESSPSIEESVIECPSSVTEDLNTVGVSDSSAVIITSPDCRACSANSCEDGMASMGKVNPGATPLSKIDVGVADADEASHTADEIAIPPRISNGIVPSSGGTPLSCNSMKEDGAEKVADIVPISLIEDKKTGGGSRNGSMKDTSIPIAIATGKAEIISDKPGTSSRGIPEVDRKHNGTDNSCSKLKPIFSPGFLGKQTKKKCMKRTADVMDKQQKPASGGSSCSPSNGHCQDHSFTDEETTYGHTEVSSNNLSKDADIIQEDITIQEVRGSVSLETKKRITNTDMVDVSGSHMI